MKYTKNKHLHTAAVIAVTVAGLLTGCDKEDQQAATEHAIESAAKAQGQEVVVNIDNNKTTIETKDDEGKKVTYEASDNAATITTEDGNMTMQSGDAAKIPDSYPEDGVMYPNLKLDVAAVQENAIMLAGTTSDPADKVQAELTAQAKSKGWEPQGTFQQAGVQMASFTKDNRALSITLNAAAGNGTQVSITLGQQ